MNKIKLITKSLGPSNIMRVLGAIVFVVVLLLAARDLQTEEMDKLFWGDRSPDVAQLQKKLIQKDLYEGPVTGFYNRATVIAVRKFQKEKKLTANGIVDNKTRSYLMAPSEEVDPSKEEVYLLSAIIESEAADEPYIGKLAVGAVILNRVDSSAFPNTLSGVVFQPGAFESVQNGQFGRQVSPQSRRAAREAWNGKDPSGDALYFWNPAKPVNPWVWQRRQVAQIGRHVFAQ